MAIDNEDTCLFNILLAHLHIIDNAFITIPYMTINNEATCLFKLLIRLRVRANTWSHLSFVSVNRKPEYINCFMLLQFPPKYDLDNYDSVITI